MRRRLARMGIPALLIFVLGVAGFPAPAPSQATFFEDVVIRSLEISAELRPVPYREVCERSPAPPGAPPAPPSCRATSFGRLKGKTVVQVAVTSPTPVSIVRLFFADDFSMKVTASVPVTVRREGFYINLTFNPALAPGATGTLTFEYEGETWDLWDEFIWVAAGDLYPGIASPFGDFHTPNRSQMRITVTIPSGYLLASSGRVTRQEAGGMQTYQWVPGEPLASIGVVGGKGHVSLARKAGEIDLALVVRPGYDRFADQIAEFTKQSADFLSRLLYAFPHNQLTVMSAPFDRGLLGIGYPGLLMITDLAFIGGTGDLLDRDSFRLLVIAHEATHTYFPHQTSGRGIAARWMSEGFAEYLGLMAVEAAMGRAAFLRELDVNRRWYASVAGRDRAVGDYTVLNSGFADGVAVVYAKGSFILHMLRFVVGTETFQKILQTYATRFRNQSARVDDFAQVSSEVAGQDLSWFFRQWIHELVLPDYVIVEATSASVEEGFRTTAKVRNLQTGFMPVEVLFEMEGGERVLQRVEVRSGVEGTVTVTTPRPVRRVEADPDKWILQSNYRNDSAQVR